MKPMGTRGFPSCNYERKVLLMKKRLYRIESGKMLAGVCGGIAEYFDIDPTLVRALWVLFCILGGSGILLYIILAVLIPSEDSLS